MGGDQSSDGADASLATKRPVMVLPRALAILLAATALLAGSYSALGQVPVALVEELVAPHADVEAMEYLIAGRVIHLMSNETLVLGYFQSCWRERITGGTVTVGTDQSTVSDGQVSRDKVECDGGRLRLTTQQSAHGTAVVFRNPGPVDSRPEISATVYGRSPIFSLHGGGPLLIERLDRRGERFELDIAQSQLVRGIFYDLADPGIALSPGGVYRAVAGDREIIFKIDPWAQPRTDSVISRLIRF